jgi:hypothetical protein
MSNKVNRRRLEATRPRRRNHIPRVLARQLEQQSSQPRSDGAISHLFQPVLGFHDALAHRLDQAKAKHRVGR